MSSKSLQHLSSVCLRAFATFVLPILLLVPAQGKADTVYTSLGSFDGATGSTTTVTFNGIAAHGSFVGESSPFTLSGLQFSSSSNLFVIDPAFYGFPYTGGGFLTVDFHNPDVLTVALPSGTTAIGFNYGGLFGAPGSFLVTLSDGFSTTLTTTGSTASGNLSFAGFTSSTPLTSITLDLPDQPEYNALDNFVYGAAAPTPEPASLGLVLTGLLGVAGAAKHRFQS